MDIDIPQNVKAVIERLEAGGYEAYAVGGCVRDLMMGRKPKDYDIAVSALPEQTKKCFQDHKVFETGIKHGTVTIAADGENIEVTTFRADGNYSDCRRPESVSFLKDIRGDLARRDFTVNAMAYNPRTGIVDLFGGADDLRRKRISCVGDPSERFSEDALRIMRALRLASELDFDIDEKTKEAIHKMKYLLNKISCERTSRELVLLLNGVAPFKILTRYADVIAAIVPEIEPCIGFEQHSRYHIYDVWTHIAAAVSRSVQQPDVRLALMLHDIEKPSCYRTDSNGNGHFFGHEKASAETAEKILRRLHFSNDTVKRVTTLIRYHSVKPASDDRTVKRLLSSVGEENFFLLVEVMKGDNSAKQDFCAERIQAVESMQKKAKEIISEKECFKLSDLSVNGRDIAKLGFCGEEIGIVLNKLLGEVIDGKISNDKAALLKLANEQFYQK